MLNQDNSESIGEDLLLAIAPQVIFTPVEQGVSSSQYWNLSVGGFSISEFGGAWSQATGAGITISIVDEGVNYRHLDLVDRYDQAIDYDPRDTVGQYDARPDNDDDQHGTQVAGVISGAAGNTIGTDGAAPDAVITASHLRYGAGFDIGELNAIMARQADYDVSNNSWGFTQSFADNFQQAWFAGLSAGIVEATTYGRDGLGTVMVMAAGNGKLEINGVNFGDDSNFHNLSNARQVIAVGAHDARGDAAFFSSPGTNVLISAPGVSMITTTGNHDGSVSSGYVSGTSFSAPMVSAAVALMLEVNPDLGYRDIQEILAITARPSDEIGAVANGAGNVNGGGLVFDRELGFGTLDAEAAVNLARTWTATSTAANEEHLTGSFGGAVAIDPLTTVLELDLPDPGGKFRLDFVELTLDIVDPGLRQLGITLVSPDGTRAIIAENLNAAGSRTALKFTFSSVVTWGESPYGKWTLEFTHPGPVDGLTVNAASLDLYGDSFDAGETHYVTGAFAGLVAADADRAILEDDDGGVDTLNFVTAGDRLVVDLSGGSANRLGATAFTLAGAFENVIGTTRADVITGSRADNTLDGDHGDDRLFGLQGDDRLFGGLGDDRLSGGKGADLLDGGEGFDTADYAEGRAVSINLATGRMGGDAAGDRLVSIEAFQLSRFDDSFIGSRRNDTVDGGRGDDALRGEAGADRLSGGGGNDTLRGDAGADRLDGGRGDDGLYGGSGRDALFGGSGEDLLVGGDGKDELRGGRGDDRLRGGEGGDTLIGESGNDRVFGDAGADRLDGGQGNDMLYGGSGRDTLRGGAGEDLLAGGAGNDELRGGRGDDRLRGGEGRDTLIGEGGRDKLFGDAGNDRLVGGEGNDRLYGDAGNDVLIGGAGRDRLFGGEGRDVFVFARNDGLDRVGDFGRGDRLDLGAFNFDGLRDALDAFSENGRGWAVFDYRGTEIVLARVDLDDLNRGDFIL